MRTKETAIKHKTCIPCSVPNGHNYTVYSQNAGWKESRVTAATPHVSHI